MKGTVAIEKTKERLSAEFELRKKEKLEGITRHKNDLEQKIQKLQQEVQTLDLKIQEVKESHFRDDSLSEVSRKAQREASLARKK